MDPTTRKEKNNKKRPRELTLTGKRRAEFAQKYSLLVPASDADQDAVFKQAFCAAFENSGASQFHANVMSQWRTWTGYQKHTPVAHLVSLHPFPEGDFCSCLQQLAASYEQEKDKLGIRMYALDPYDFTPIAQSRRI